MKEYPWANYYFEGWPELLDGTEYVRYFPEYGVVFAWYGGHYVYIYDLLGRDVEQYSTGNYARGRATLEEVKLSIETMLEGKEKIEEE